jgi:hypothetical protein
MERQIIYGVYDKTTDCGSYTGFFKFNDDAKKELHNQMSYQKEELGIEGLEVKKDRVVKVNGRVEEIFYIIHPIVLR